MFGTVKNILNKIRAKRNQHVTITTQMNVKYLLTTYNLFKQFYGFPSFQQSQILCVSQSTCFNVIEQVWFD